MNYNTISASFLYARLEEQFKPSRCTDVFPKVGLQMDNTDKIHKVYTATFANPTVISEILSRGEKDILLFTHHPRPPMPNLGTGYVDIPEDMVEEMSRNRISLFSYHIALDGGGYYSPSYTLGRAIGANIYDFWYFQNGVNIGSLCQSRFHTVNELADRFAETLGHRVSCYPYGGNELRDGKFAIMPGCAKSVEAYSHLRDIGVTAMVTGVTAKTADWVDAVHKAAEENGIALLGGTHCSTEQFAPRTMCGYFENLGIESEFIPEAPNMNEI